MTILCGDCGRDFHFDEKLIVHTMRVEECPEASALTRCECGRYFFVRINLSTEGHVRIRSNMAPEGVVETALLAARFACSASRN